MAKMESSSDDCTGTNVPLSICAETLDRLFTIYYDRIFAFSVHRLFSRDAAEEVSSQVFVTAARKIHTVRGLTEQEFACWLFAIAVNHCRSHQRKTGRRKILFRQYRESRGQSRLESTDSPASQPPDWSALYAALASLKEREHTILTLRYFEGLSYEEIAAIVGKPVNTVRVNLHRGLKKMQILLKSEFLNPDRE